MAAKKYRNLSELVVAGSQPGEEFEFDYDQPGFNAQLLIDNGLIEALDEPKKEELVALAQERGVEGAARMTKDELKAAIDAAGKEQ